MNEWQCSCGWAGPAGELERLAFGGIVCPYCRRWHGLEAADDGPGEEAPAGPAPAAALDPEAATDSTVAEAIERIRAQLEALSEGMAEAALAGRISPHWQCWLAYRCVRALDMTRGGLHAWRRGRGLGHLGELEELQR